MNDLPSTRAEARASGAKLYFTGKPCKHGHLSPKRTITGNCDECAKGHIKNWQEANREKELERLRRDYVANKAKKDMASRSWDIANRAARAEISKRYRDRNPEKHRALVMKWDQAYPERRKALRHKRRALELAADGSFTGDDIKAIHAKQGGRCASCGNSGDLTIDHIKALTKGGTNWPNNLQLLCRSCNSRKRTKDNEEFMRLMGVAA